MALIRINGSGASPSVLVDLDLGKDFSNIGNLLTRVDYVNVLDYGAVADGVTDNTASFTAAIATGKAVFVPEGTFNFTGAVAAQLLTLGTGQTIFGIREKSIMKVSSSSLLLVLQPYSVVDSISFVGTKSKTVADSNQSGITASTNDTGWVIRNCTFRNLGGADSTFGGGIRISAIVSGYQEGGSIFGCYFYDNFTGLFIGERGEYVEVVGCKFINNKHGLRNNAGNTLIHACNMQDNTYGLDFQAGTNNGHGVVSGCNINHNTTNLRIADIPTQGMTFSGCHFYAGDISISDSIGINFVGCDFSQGNITLTNNTVLQRLGCRVPISPTSNAMPINLVSGSTFTDVNNLDF